MISRVLPFAFALNFASAAAQQSSPGSPIPERLAHTAGTGPLSASALISKLAARSVGPMVDGAGRPGRISAIAVYEKDPHIFFVGSASGGVFKTENGGKTFTAFFDRQGASSIGDVAVSQNDANLVWVGTGEGWHRNDVGWGDGIYKTTDGGKTWQNMGLPTSNSFGKVLIHPRNNDIVFAAVLGSAWGVGRDRGVYKTTDGGKSWRKVLYVNERTGAADLAIDPKNPQNMLAAMWDHLRRPYNFIKGGPGSAIYRSTDGGETWHHVTRGLPMAEMGRIAVDYHRADPRHVAATIDVALPHTGFYRSMDGGETWVEMPAMPVSPEGVTQPDGLNKHWGRPYYDNLVRYDPVDVNKIYHGSPTHFTADGGRTWHGFATDVHATWIDPNNPRHAIHGNDLGVIQCWNAGQPRVEDSQCESLYLPPIGQFYAVGYDMRKLYRVIGGQQDNFSPMVPTQSRNGAITFVDTDLLPGGDGSKAMADPEDWTTVYTMGAGPDFYRSNVRNTQRVDISPFLKLRAGRNSYTDPRTNAAFLKSGLRLRSTSIATFLISPWNSKTLYFGANYLFRSVDRGDTWRIISPDLTNDKLEWQIPQTSYEGNDDTGDWAVLYQGIRTISESPLKQGMIWVGTDDGNVQLTLDDGAHWTNLTKNIPGLPQYSWVSHIYASRFVEGRAYATFDRHRAFDLNPYVYVTEDSGKTWTNITINLPANVSSYVIKEGLKNPDLLFLGTEFGLWISMDRGRSWSRYQEFEVGMMRGSPVRSYFPTVAVHDLEIHPRELELIIGTHGRSIWTLPIQALEELTTENRARDVYFVSPANVYLFPVPDYEQQGVIRQLPGGFSANTQPGTEFYYHLREAIAGEATISIADPSGQEVYARLSGAAQPGLNAVPFGRNLGHLPIRRPGEYRAVLSVGGKEYVRTLHVEDVSDEDAQTAPPRTYPANDLYRALPKR